MTAWDGDWPSRSAVRTAGDMVFERDLFAVGQVWRHFLFPIKATIVALDASTVWYTGCDGKRRNDGRQQFHLSFPTKEGT